VVAYLITTARRKKRAEETPKNLQPWLSDDELENRRLTRILGSAVVAAAALAILLPVYYINETDRQARAAESFDELYVEEGNEWFRKFECFACHGADGNGGAAPHVEARSGLTVQWAVPSLNDIFFRYSEEEVRFWIEFGRDGTPMPPNGLAGGGAMTVQEIDQVMAYLQSTHGPPDGHGLPQLSQSDAYAKVEGAVALALSRIENGAGSVATAILEQQAVIDDITDSPGQFAIIDGFPQRVIELLTGDGTCTAESAALVGSSCNIAGPDADRDGIADFTERALTNDIGTVIDDVVVIRTVAGGEVEKVHNVADYAHLYELDLDPSNPFSMSDSAGHATADLDTVDAFVRDLDAAHLTLRVISERTQRFLDGALAGLEALEFAANNHAWEVDFDTVATTTGLSPEEARRAVGLFNAYCARCHTSGYSAGVAFEQEPGSGAWAPALTGGRSVTQFPDEADQLDFIIRGSVLAEAYGTNGIGRGWMPGFGQVLSEDDIKLIIAFERSL